MSARARKQPSASPSPPPENERAEIETILRRPEELRRTASNSDLRSAIKRSRQDDLALLGALRADARMPNRAKRIRALCQALDVPVLPTDPAGSAPLTIDGVAEQPP